LLFCPDNQINVKQSLHSFFSSMVQCLEVESTLVHCQAYHLVTQVMFISHSTAGEIQGDILVYCFSYQLHCLQHCIIFYLCWPRFSLFGKEKIWIPVLNACPPFPRCWVSWNYAWSK